MKRFLIDRPEGFSLAAAAAFYADFTPGSGMAAAAAHHGLTLSLRLDGDHRAVVVTLRDDGERLVATWASPQADPVAEEVLRRQLDRILGLDADGAAWRAVGARDRVMGGLQRAFPGFFTAAKSSPYDAATWAVLQPRASMAQAARWRVALAEAHGDAIELEGRTHHVFPSPERLLSLDRFATIPDEKVRRLRSVAAAACEGRLESHRLRAMSEEAALAELQTLRGVGPWAASHIYYRGVAPPDALSTAEPRVLHGLALAYGLASPTMATLERLAEAWRPFRMWGAILLARNLAGTPGWHAPTLRAERAAAGNRLNQRLVAARQRR